MRIAFISPCGFGNLGDVAIQDAFLDNVRRQLAQDIEFVGITQNPSDTELRHRVRAVPMDVEAFRIRSVRSRGSHDDRVIEQQKGRSRAFAALIRPPKRLVKELFHLRIAVREMRRTDVLAVSGGGQLDDHWGGPWRVPYALWKWSLLARLFRKRIVFLSVGAGTTESRMTRFFLRAALSRADYASFRDNRTAGRVREQGLSSSRRVVPDLAFSHLGRSGEPRPTSTSTSTIALSPIAFLDPTVWPAKNARAYRSYVSRTADLARQLVARGFHVVLCTSDAPDITTAEQVLRDASNTDGRPPSGTLEFADTRALADLLDCFRSADLAIASRLHGVILANLVGTPTIALSYDWKVDEHMRAMGLERYRFPIGSFDPREVIDAVDDVLSHRDAVAAVVTDRCERLGAQVVAQYQQALMTLEPGTALSPDRA
jgi:polysaccharide pyruvyl transferase WcaK-like protein